MRKARRWAGLAVVNQKGSFIALHERLLLAVGDAQQQRHLRKPSTLARHAGYSKNSMGPPEGVGLGGNSGPTSSVYMTFFRWLVVV